MATQAFLALRGDNKVEMRSEREGARGDGGLLHTEGGWEINSKRCLQSLFEPQGSLCVWQKKHTEEPGTGRSLHYGAVVSSQSFCYCVLTVEEWFRNINWLVFTLHLWETHRLSRLIKKTSSIWPLVHSRVEKNMNENVRWGVPGYIRFIKPAGNKWGFIDSPLIMAGLCDC